MLFAMMPGYALQRILTGEPEPDLFKSGLRTLLAPAAYGQMACGRMAL